MRLDEKSHHRSEKDHLLGVLLVHAAVGLLLEDDLAVDPHPRSLVFPSECTLTFAFGKTCLMILSEKLASLSPPQAEQYSTSTLTVWQTAASLRWEGQLGVVQARCLNK